MISKQQYDQWISENKILVGEAQKEENEMMYHFFPPTGWLNDPNGLFEKDGVYHIYYQYSPDEINGGKKIWGHATTLDFIKYINHDPFLYADCEWDKDGVYSGSAYVEEGEISFYYTGNVRHLGKEYDYINSGREQNTICVKSNDGFHAQTKQLILSNKDYPSHMSNHVRDPKIVKMQNEKYMLLGARTQDDQGCILLYTQTKERQWEYCLCIQTKDTFGYMWECPDIVLLDNEYFLITCPQGVKKEEFRFQNEHQCGYFPLSMNLEKKQYELKSFEMLDYGFDFYAPQTFQDAKNRTILIAWMAVPDAKFQSKEKKSNWNHILTMPRELIRKNNKISQRPLPELKQLRQSKREIEIENEYTQTNKTFHYEVKFKFNKCDTFCIKLRNHVYLKYDKKVFTLDMEDSQCERDKRCAVIESIYQIQVFSDTSCLEIFINDGEYVFSTRVFDQQPCNVNINVTGGKVKMEYFELIKFKGQ